MAETIELAEAKLHCRIDGDDEDLLIQAYIDAALEVCQKHIGKRFDSNPYAVALSRDATSV